MTTKNLTNDPVGIGIRYPLTFSGGRMELTAKTRIAVTPDGGIGDDRVDTIETLVANDTERKAPVRQSMARIVQVPQGQQFMAGDKGSRVDLVPFEVNDETTHNLVLFYALDSINSQESRISVLDAQAVQDADEDHVIDGLVTYKIKTTQIVDTAVVFSRGEQ